MATACECLVVIILILTIGGCGLYEMYVDNQVTLKKMELELKKIELQSKMYNGE